MTTILDPLVATVGLLKTDADVVSLCGSRVFGGELPDSENDAMPRTAIVCRLAGSPRTFGGGYQEFGDHRVDVRCYGPTVYRATELARAAWGKLDSTRRVVIGGTIFHWAIPSGGMMQLRDDDTEWPFTLSSWQVLVAERT